MLLAQGRYWRITLVKGEVDVSLLREAQSEVLPELTIEVPLERWNRVFKNVYTDRKLLGGILLDFAKHKDHVATAVAQDRLYAELQRLVIEATATLVEAGRLALTVVDIGMD